MTAICCRYQAPEGVSPAGAGSLGSDVKAALPESGQVAGDRGDRYPENPSYAGCRVLPLAHKPEHGLEALLDFKRSLVLHGPTVASRTGLSGHDRVVNIRLHSDRPLSQPTRKHPGGDRRDAH